MFNKRRIIIGTMILLIVISAFAIKRNMEIQESVEIYNTAREYYYSQMEEEKELENNNQNDNIVEIEQPEIIEDTTSEDIVVEEEPTPVIKPEPITIEDIDFDEVKNLVGWIKVKGTNIDYPIVQAEDNDFYLNHNYLNQQSLVGAIYMDFRNNGIDADRNNIIYGHKIFDGSMFSDLSFYVQASTYEDYFNNNNIIVVDDFDTEVSYKIFSAYVVDLDQEEYYLYTKYKNDAAFETFIEDIKNRSIVKSDISIDMDDKLITLVTCNFWYDNARVIVHGVKI